MGFLKNLFGNEDKKMVVLGLDGVPFTFMERMVKEGRMPSFESLLDKGYFKRMNSVLPTISSVAWSSFMTGKDAAGHNIFGFIDRKSDPFNLFVPTAKHMKAPTIWDEIGKMDQKSVVMNVPVTYPPKEINGVLVSGFLATDINKATYPKNVAQELKGMNYVIDADTWTARDSKDEFLNELNHALERRFKTMFKFLEEKEWNYFQCHIMETDRINHFYWGDMVDDHPEFAERFYSFYEKIDNFIGELMERLDDKTELMILSDHGFCKTKKEVQLNYWLEEEGYLKYNKDEVESVADMAPESKAYSLLPGRIYINRKGREEMGAVSEKDYENLRKEIRAGLLELENEENGEKIIDQVFYREEIYQGPYLDQAADLIAIPHEGYDLKGKADQDSLLEDGFIQGMHTYDDAFIYVKDNQQERLSDNFRGITDIKDVNKLILNYFEG